MKLKTRLIISFLLTTLLPLLFAAIIGSAVIIPQLMMLNESYGIETSNVCDYINSSFGLLNKLNHMVDEQVREEVKNDPDMFRDMDWVKKLNNDLEGKNSYIVIRQFGEYTFIGTSQTGIDVINRAVLYDDMTDYEFLEKYGQIYSVVPVTYSDGSEAKIFVFTETNDVIPEVRRIMISIAIVVVIILLLTATVLVYWIYSSIIQPIGALRVAAQNIKDGHLDFDIEIRNDEMGQLAADFDDMRKRLKQSAEEKVAYDEESRQLISNISHDLKTPLTSIKGYVEGLQDGVANTPEKQQKYIHIISTKVNDMTRLIDELSLYSKIDTNKIPYNFMDISVNDYFDDCAYDIRQDLEARGIEFGFFNYLKGDVHILADPEQFNRVINNIVGNSVKYMDKTKEKGRINIRIGETDTKVLIDEEDNGVGIDEKDLPYVFDRFYRADASRASTGGSGIGLAIVKKIVEDHGGTISAKSTLHAGTVIHIELNKYIEPEVNGDEQNFNC
ncbi:MAG: HAMP domain-containing histidine kinase [Lachnospiraceae bacterium]|nr:HAMP domain-containing histidine kinase [Lachnospiraceae bacterium]